MDEILTLIFAVGFIQIQIYFSRCIIIAYYRIIKFFIQGSETTAITVSFTLLMLAMEQSIQVSDILKTSFSFSFISTHNFHVGAAEVRSMWKRQRNILTFVISYIQLCTKNQERLGCYLHQSVSWLINHEKYTIRKIFSTFSTSTFTLVLQFGT